MRGIERPRRGPLLTLLLAWSLLCGRDADAARYRIRWVLLEEPTAQAEAAAKDFAARVEKDSRGELGVEVLTRGQYDARFNGGRSLGALGLLGEVASGKAEMCEANTGLLGGYAHGLWVLGMPYLFKDYEHAERVLGGDIGRDLLGGLLQPSAQRRAALRGLGLTHAGFGVYAAMDRQARAPRDLRGLRLRVSGHPVSNSMARRIGAEAVVVSLDGFAPLADKDLVDAAETTLADLEAAGLQRRFRAITDTRHFLPTSAIVINEKFFQDLPRRYQDLVQRAAARAARAQRDRSVERDAQARLDLEKLGVALIEPTPEERGLFQEQLATVQGDVGVMIGIEGQDLIEAISGQAQAASGAAARP